MGNLTGAFDIKGRIQRENLKLFDLIQDYRKINLESAAVMIHVIKKSRLEEFGAIRSAAIRISGGILLLVMAIIGAAFVSETANDTRMNPSFPDEYTFVEVLPLELIGEISQVVDERPLIDRITLEMISTIPLDPVIVYPVNQEQEPTLDQD